MEEVSDIVHPGASRGVRTFAWAGLVIIVGSMLGILIAFFFQNGEDLGAAGETEEDRTERPSDLVIPTIVDVTAAWGLDTWESVGADPLRGGATLHDLDGDGDLDLVVAGGSLGIYLWEGDRYTSGPSIDAGDAIAAHAGDVDGDGAVDLLVGRSDGASIVWGGSALLDGATPEILDLGVDGVVTGAVPADLGLGSASVVVLGHGGAEPIADQVLTFDGRDIVDRVALPNSDRKSASLEILDLEGDGVAELWIGRDLGWSSGGDSVYSRGGAVDGAWVDIAPGLGVDLEIDTMAVTIADWTRRALGRDLRCAPRCRCRSHPGSRRGRQRDQPELGERRRRLEPRRAAGPDRGQRRVRRDQRPQQGGEHLHRRGRPAGDPPPHIRR